MGGKQIAAVLAVLAIALGGAYYMGVLQDFIPVQHQPTTALAQAAVPVTDPLSDQATAMARKCVTEFMQRGQIEIQNLTVASPQERALSPADGLNGLIYVSNFNVLFTAKIPGENWQDFAWKMAATKSKSEGWVIEPTMPDLNLNPWPFQTYMMNYTGHMNWPRWDCKQQSASMPSTSSAPSISPPLSSQPAAPPATPAVAQNASQVASMQDGFEAVQCTSDVPRALIGKRMKNERVVVIEARHADIGLKDLGAYEVSDRMTSITWHMCGGDFMLLQDGAGVVRNVLLLPPHEHSQMAFMMACQVNGQSETGIFVALLGKDTGYNPNAPDTTFYPAEAAWKIDVGRAGFLKLPGNGVYCATISRSGGQ